MLERSGPPLLSSGDNPSRSCHHSSAWRTFTTAHLHVSCRTETGGSGASQKAQHTHPPPPPTCFSMASRDPSSHFKQEGRPGGGVSPELSVGEAGRVWFPMQEKRGPGLALWRPGRQRERSHGRALEKRISQGRNCHSTVFAPQLIPEHPHPWFLHRSHSSPPLHASPVAPEWSQHLLT